MVLSIILTIISVIISVLGIISSIFIRKELGYNLNLFINILLFTFYGCFFYVFLTLSSDSLINPILAFNFWRISIIFWIISLSFLSFLQFFVIKFNKIILFFSFIYAFLGTIIIGISYQPNAIIQIRINSYYIYILENLALLVFLGIFNFLIFVLMWYNFIANLESFRDNKAKFSLLILTSFFTFMIILYSLYIFTQNIYILTFYQIFFLISVLVCVLAILKNPEMYVEQTNRIYDFIIFHRSGILLFSYNFETGKEIDENMLKGTILIGINHILSNFVNKKNQLTLIKMKKQDIILEYDSNNGYAILLITNNKNLVIQKAVQRFMERFNSIHKETFKKMNELNQIIDISEFKIAKDILHEFFSPYI